MFTTSPWGEEEGSTSRNRRMVKAAPESPSFLQPIHTRELGMPFVQLAYENRFLLTNFDLSDLEPSIGNQEG